MRDLQCAKGEVHLTWGIAMAWQGALGKEPFDVRKYDGLIGREFGRRAIRYKAI